MRGYLTLLALVAAAIVTPEIAHCQVSPSPGQDESDYIQADSGTYISGDRLELKGNVVFHTESAFPGVTIEVRADSAFWDEKTGVFTVPGNTAVSYTHLTLPTN